MESEKKTRLVVFYKGKPVKKMRRGPHGIILTMWGKESGKAGPQITVSQEQWEQYGEKRKVPYVDNSQLRRLA